MNELKSCPHCDGEAETKMYLWGHHAETKVPIWCYYVYCMSCNAMTDNVFRSKPDAIAAWNRRAQPDNAPLTLEELRGIAESGDPVWMKGRQHHEPAPQ